MSTRFGVAIIVCVLLVSQNAFSDMKESKKGCVPSATEKLIENLSNRNGKPPVVALDECICIALKKNTNREISVIAVSIAEAQHKQSMSSYWPEINLNFGASIMEEDLNFIFPAEVSEYSISGIAPVPMDVTVNIPEKDIKVMGKELYKGALEFKIPLYAGGIRPAISKQAELGVEAAKQSLRRTELKLIFDVKKMYYAGLLSEDLVKTGEEALGRLNVTLMLTEQLYKKGSGSVRKTDYLRNKVMVESLNSIVTGWKSNRTIAKTALANTMGINWDAAFELSGKDIPFRVLSASADDFVKETMEFNPDWKRLQKALEIAEAKIKEEKGGYLPKLMLSGTTWNMHSDYDEGVETGDNYSGWKIELGMQVPVFQGFITKSRVSEAKLRHRQLKKQKRLMEDGLALQVNHAFLKVKSLNHQKAASFKAYENAKENRKLNIRAYESGMVKTQDVLEAQLMESLMEVRYRKMLYEYAEAGFYLDFLIGKNQG